MAQIMLGGGLAALIDEADVDRCFGPRWFRHQTRLGRIYVAARIQERFTYLHRFILDAPPDLDVVHINGDRLDSRRQNLRLATRQESVHSRRAPAAARSGFLGVHINDRGAWPSILPWRAAMRFNGRRISLGSYATPEEAARARDFFANRLLPRIAQLNLPDQLLDDPLPAVEKALRRFR
jgi:hypothetical protein